MTPFTSLLVATDLSLQGNHAIRRGALLADGHGARLHVLHVVDAAGRARARDGCRLAMDIDRRTAEARDALQRVAVEITAAHDVTPTIEVVVGDLFETLMRASDGADLVVIGRRDRGRFGAFLTRGTADRLPRSCRRPVLVVRTPVVQPYRRLLVPTDFSAPSDAALRFAMKVRHRASLHVFHAMHPRRDAVLRDADVPEHIIRATRLTEETRTHARMRRQVTDLGLDGATVHLALAHGTAVDSISSRARQLGADLVVVGQQDRSPLVRILLGSVTRHLLSAAQSDVLFLPRPRHPSPGAVLARWPHSEPAFVTAHMAGRLARAGTEKTQ